jgi:3-oxoacyl-(acyl-carrier-protein) synthase
MDRITQILTLCIKPMITRLAGSLAIEPETIGMCTSTNFGIFNSIMEFMIRVFKSGPGRANPMDYPNTAFNAGSGYACIESRLKGYNNTIGEIGALGEAYDALALNRARFMVAAGVEEAATYQRHLVEGRSPAWPQSEGAAALVLSSDPKARPLAWHLGYTSHYAKPLPNDLGPGLDTALMSLLERLHLTRDHIDGVVLSTSSHPLEIHQRSFEQSFGKSWSDLPVFHLESALGLMGGASEAMAAVMAIQILSESTWPGQPSISGSPYHHPETTQTFDGKVILIVVTDPWGLTMIHLLAKE